MKQEEIDRINELFKKSKGVGLTDEEKNEQASLRQKYIDSIKRNFKNTLDGIEIKK